MFKETLELEGWRVETCAHGLVALRLIEGDARFDLLLLDNELPAMSGIELTRRARSLSHRRQTPIIVISASVCGRAAREAGADAFLKKPEDVGKLLETIERLLSDRREVCGEQNSVDE